MPNAAYKKGLRNEHRSIAFLEAAGYRCIRSAGSHGEWDIWAVGAHDFVFCQTRTRDWPGPVERQMLAEWGPCPKNTRKLLHRWRNGQRHPDVMEL